MAKAIDLENKVRKLDQLNNDTEKQKKVEESYKQILAMKDQMPKETYDQCVKGYQQGFEAMKTQKEVWETLIEVLKTIESRI